MCNSSNSNGKNLTAGQLLLSGVNVQAVIGAQITLITSIGLVPKEVTVSRMFYDILKDQFAEFFDIDDNSAFDLKKTHQLPLRVLENEREFKHSNISGMVLPIVVTYTLPEVVETRIVHQLEDDSEDDAKELGSGCGDL